MRRSSGAPIRNEIGVPSTQRGRRTREALLIAAREVFERDGFLNARITDIAQGAGVAHGTFYTYFDSKESAFREVILNLQTELLGVGQPAEGSDNPTEAIALSNLRYLEGYRRNSKMMVIWEQVATFEPALAELMHEGKLAFVARAERAIERWQAAGLADKRIDPHYAAHALTGMVSRFAYSWFAQGEPFDLDRAVEQLTLIWANGIGLRDTGTQRVDRSSAP